MTKLFSDEKVNSGRQVELDIAKALSIIFMIFLHTIMVVKGFDQSLSPAYDFVFSNVLGRPFAAPVFMFCMGVGVVYSRHSQWDTMIKRGIKLYLTGILVNFFEFFLPHFLCGTLLGKWDIFPISRGLLLFCVDILAFAGLTFILMGILKKFKVSNKGMIIVAVVLSLIGTFARGFDFANPALNLIFAMFIGTKGGFGAFTLCNWFIIPVAGYVWGQYFIRAKDKGRFFRLWPIYIIAALIFFYVSSFTFKGGIFAADVHLYYFMNTLDAIFCIICAHGIIGLCYYLNKILPDSVRNIFKTLSSNITVIYIAQWCFIPIGIILLAYLFKGLVFTDVISAIYSICILILSTLFAVNYKKWRKSSN